MKKQYILVLKPNTTHAEFQELLDKYNILVKIDWDALKRHYTLEFDDTQKQEIKKESCVYHVTEADAPVRLMESQRIEVSRSGYGGNWGLTRICQRENWSDKTWYPNSGTYTFFRTGEGVDIYVVDTGARFTHADFNDRIFPLYDHYRSSNDPRFCWDEQGHGTHVASVAAGAKYGVAKKARIYVSRVFETGGATLSAIIAGINACLLHHINKSEDRPSVMNLSLGGPAHWIEEQAINDCINSGIVCVAAAGNDGKNLDEAGYDIMPAEIDRAITVGSVNIQDQISSFSNYGHMVDVFAPGHYITAASYRGDSAELMLSGTSMAAPHVAGICALKLEKRKKTVNSQHVMEIHDWVRENSTPNTLYLSEAVTNAGTVNRLAFSDFVDQNADQQQETIEVSRNSSDDVTRTMEIGDPITEVSVEDRTETVNNQNGTHTTTVIRTTTTTTITKITTTITTITTTIIGYSDGSFRTVVGDPVHKIEVDYDTKINQTEEILSTEVSQNQGGWRKRDRSNWMTGRNQRRMGVIIKHFQTIERMYEHYIGYNFQIEQLLNQLETAAETLAKSKKSQRISAYNAYTIQRNKTIYAIRQTWKENRK